MSDATSPLTDEERAELEQLRAEKAKREQAAQDRREREELARLRAQREAQRQEAAEDARIAEVREKNRKLMEPDDDLKMPIGQKVVLLAVVIIAIALALMFLRG